MSNIQAKILYDEIKSNNPEGGLYLWLSPNERSILKLQTLMQDAPFKVVMTTNLHCTLMYHHDKLPEQINIPEDREMLALLEELVLWTDHQDELILVGLLKSEDLENLYKECSAEGLKHSFEEYTAHITLGKNVIKTTEVDNWLNEKNEYLKHFPLIVDFDEKIKGSSLA